MLSEDSALSSLCSLRLKEWWSVRISRQQKIDKSIAAKADFEFLYDEPHANEFSKLGRIPVLKARMNADLHMAEDLKNTGKGNIFVIFGEPDITLLPQDDGKLRVKVNGVDVFKPQTGEVTSHGTGGIACGFIDTDCNEESFCLYQAPGDRSFQTTQKLVNRILNQSTG